MLKRSQLGCTAKISGLSRLGGRVSGDMDASEVQDPRGVVQSGEIEPLSGGDGSVGV